MVEAEPQSMGGAPASQNAMPAGGTHTESRGYPPLPQPDLRGDVQGSAIGTYLRKRINEEQFDAFCIDCQNNRSSHCNVTFGTFLCGECVAVHEATYPMFQCYIKPLFDEAWDTFQITCVQVGGNQRFFEFLRDYGKERDPIARKYDSGAAKYYRARLCAQAKNLPFNELPPAKSATEFADR